MRPNLKVVSYQTREDFQNGLNAEFAYGYFLQSWQMDNDGTWGIVAVYTSKEAIIETAKTITAANIEAAKGFIETT